MGSNLFLNNSSQYHQCNRFFLITTKTIYIYIYTNGVWQKFKTMLKMIFYFVLNDTINILK